MKRQLCMLKGCCLVDPTRGRKSQPVDTHVFINPDLKIHPFILGMNSMCDFRLSFSGLTERVTGEHGQQFRLLSERRALEWDNMYAWDAGVPGEGFEMEGEKREGRPGQGCPKHGNVIQ